MIGSFALFVAALALAVVLPSVWTGLGLGATIVVLAMEIEEYMRD